MSNDEALETLIELEHILDVEWTNAHDPETIALIEEMTAELCAIRKRAESSSN